MQMKGESNAAAELLALSQLINQVSSAAQGLPAEVGLWVAPHVYSAGAPCKC